MRLHRLEARVDLPPHENTERRQQGHGNGGHQREARRQVDHEGERKTTAGDGARQIHDRRPDSHANGAQIVCQPRHQVAGAHPGVECCVNRFQLSE